LTAPIKHAALFLSNDENVDGGVTHSNWILKPDEPPHLVALIVWPFFERNAWPKGELLESDVLNLIEVAEWGGGSDGLNAARIDSCKTLERAFDSI
jgi:hypothetical protein